MEFNSGFKGLTNGDQWKGHEVIEISVLINSKKKRFPSAAITSLMGLYPRSAGKLHSLDKGHGINVVDIKISSLLKSNSNQLVNSDTHQPIQSYAHFSICKTELRIFLSYQGSQYEYTALPVFMS